MDLALIICSIALLLFDLKPTTCLQTYMKFNMNSSIVQNINDFTNYHYTYRNRTEKEWYKEAKLLNYLLRDYNPHIIPRENTNESLKLYIGLAMSQLINLVSVKL